MTSEQLQFDDFSEDSEDLFTLEDLNHIWMEDGLPLFFDDYPNICDIVESLGFSIYYIIANQAVEVKPASTGSVTYTATAKPYTPPTPIINRSTKIFKVVNNFVGRSVSISNPSLPNTYIDMEEEAVYNMPAIPHLLVEKLDQFFRLIDAQHGTESIVMLTYDLNKQGPEGWGILVPDQTNTSVHCNYDPDSIARIKPDDVIIVGSVHSHPGMAAYASGTDHADQADFDGIHITFGWQKSVNNNATQYYAELQMSGKSYKLNIDDVFEDPVIDKAPDPEVVGWTDKVKKVTPPSTVGGLTPTQIPATLEPKRESTQNGTAVITPPNLFKWKDILKDYASFSVEPNAFIVAEVDLNLSNPNSTSFCPCCGTVIDDYDLFNNCCSICYIPVIQKDTPIESLFEEMTYYFTRYRLDTKVPLYLWGSTEDNAEFLIKVTPNTLYESVTYNEDNFDYLLENTVEQKDLHTLCCNQTYEQAIATCICEPQILATDYEEFDKYTKEINIYDTTSNCSSCQFYYDHACPFYKDSLISFISNEYYINLDLLSESISHFNCDSFVPYSNTYSTYHYD